MTPLPYLSVLRISGTDARKFLQAQLTANLLGLQTPEATWSAYCSAKGQVIATLLLSPRADHWLALVESSLAPVVVKKLQAYILRDDVQIEALAGHHVFGVDSNAALVDSPVVLEPRNLPLRYVISNQETVPNPEATAQWQRLELLSGLPWLDLSSSEKYIPQMLGLDAIGAVSFTKGCYPGQEVIARAHHLGEIKRRPQVLDIQGAGPPVATLPCVIHSATGKVDATLVHWVATAESRYTVFAVAALAPGAEVSSLEQGGDFWEARTASREPD